MRTRATVAVGLLLAAGLTACSSDAPGDGVASGTPSSSSPSTTATESTEPSTTDPPTPEITPATGPELLVKSIDGPVLRVRLPAEADWTVESDFASAIVDDIRNFVVSGDGNILGTSSDLGYYARLKQRNVQTDLGEPALKRMDDRTINGVEGYVLVGSNEGSYDYVFGTVYADSSVSITFQFPDDQAPGPEWIESILASAEWL